MDGRAVSGSRVVYEGLAAGLALLTFAALAGAGAGPTVEWSAAAVPGSSNGERYQGCAPEKQLVGGGVLETKPGDVGLSLHASGPLEGTTAETTDGDTPSQWYAAMTNFYTGTGKFRVYAICSDDETARIEATDLQVPEVQTEAAVAECGPEERAVSGGIVQVGGIDSFYPVASGPVDETGLAEETKDGDVARAWYGAVKHGQFGDPTYNLKVFAICSSESKARIEATKAKTRPNSGQVSAKPKCGRGKRATGGGIVQKGALADTFVAESGPLGRSGRPARAGGQPTRWFAQADGAGKTLFVSAICE